jgi:hypothetical protein
MITLPLLDRLAAARACHHDRHTQRKNPSFHRSASPKIGCHEETKATSNKLYSLVFEGQTPRGTGSGVCSGRAAAWQA